MLDTDGNLLMCVGRTWSIQGTLSFSFETFVCFMAPPWQQTAGVM